jgi:hypothetical protein
MTSEYMKALKVAAKALQDAQRAEQQRVGQERPIRPNPDDKLVRLCREFLDVAARLAHIDERLEGDDADKEEIDNLRAATEPLLLRHDELLEPIASITARTYQGRTLKAHVALAAIRTVEEITSDELFALVRSALRDVAGLPKSAPARVLA